MKSEQNNRKIETILLSLSVIMIIVSAFIIMPYLFPKVEQEQQEDIQILQLKQAFSKLSPVLNITVLDSEGNIKAQEIKEDDLVLTNFLDYLAAVFTDANGNAISFTAKDILGSTRTFTTYASSTFKNYNDIVSGTMGGHIIIGNGTTMPTRTDYQLDDDKETAMQVSEPNYFGGNITFSATFSMSANYSASEIGFMLYFTDTSNSLRNIMMFRDTYTPIPVVIGDQLIATYTIYLNNTGFTDNFGAFLTALFQATASDKTFSMDDITSTSRTYQIYQIWKNNDFQLITNFASRSKIGMSNSLGAITRSTNSIIVIGGIYLGVSQPSHNNTAIIFSVSQSMSSSGTMNSAGYFIQWQHLVGENLVLFWALNFTAVPYQQDYTVTVSFRLLT